MTDDCRELKPCPFCGGKAVVVKRLNKARQNAWKIACVDCPIQIVGQKRGSLIELWNTRTPPAGDDLLLKLNSFGFPLIEKKDLYKFLMGDKSALNKYEGDAQGDYKPRHTGAIDEMDDSVIDRIAALSAPKIDFEGLKCDHGAEGLHLSYEKGRADGWNDCLDHIAAKYPQLRGE